MKHFNKKVSENLVLRLTEFHMTDKYKIFKKDLYDENNKILSKYENEFNRMWSLYMLEFTELEEYERSFVDENVILNQKYNELMYIKNLDYNELNTSKFMSSLERKISTQKSIINKLEGSNKSKSDEIKILKDKRTNSKKCVEDLKIIKCYVTDDKIKKMCDEIIKTIK